MEKQNKILVADDDPDFVRMVCERLESQGYETLFAHEGIRTVELAARETPDLILLDWMMPVGKGDTVLANLSRNNATRHIPVVIVTALRDPKIESVAKSFGVKGFFRKPFEQTLLLQTIHDCLSHL